MPKPVTVKCKNCKKQIERDKAVIVENEKSNSYYCCEECRDEFEKKKKEKENKPVDEHWQPLMTYISELYNDEEINYGLLCKQINNLKKEIVYYEKGNPHYYTTEGILLCLKYSFETLGNVFQEEYGIIPTVRRYYKEAKTDYINNKKIRRAIKKYKPQDNIVVVKKKCDVDDEYDF